MDKRQRRVLQNKGKNKSRNVSSELANILKMVETERVHLDTFTDYLTHYAIVIPFILFLFVITWSFLHNISFEGFLIFLIALSISVAIFFMQYHRLRFKKIATNVSVSELHKIIEEVATGLDWQVHLFSEGAFACTNPSLLSGSWGEDIIILVDKKNNQVLVNSICSLQKQSSVFAFGRNKKNEQRIIQKIKEYKTTTKGNT